MAATKIVFACNGLVGGWTNLATEIARMLDYLRMEVPLMCTQGGAQVRQSIDVDAVAILNGKRIYAAQDFASLNECEGGFKNIGAVCNGSSSSQES